MTTHIRLQTGLGDEPVLVRRSDWERAKEVIRAHAPDDHELLIEMLQPALGDN